jgi:rhodanese-related sulfurtransferase
MRIKKEFAIIIMTAFIISCSCFKTTPESGITFSTVDEVSQVVTKPSANTVVIDVNPESVRNAKGIIPNSIKLSSYDKYALSELPADKNIKLIFYCYNEKCGASTEAANRAIANGWTNVSVMKAGIVGWNALQK